MCAATLTTSLYVHTPLISSGPKLRIFLFCINLGNYILQSNCLSTTIFKRSSLYKKLECILILGCSLGVRQPSPSSLCQLISLTNCNNCLLTLHLILPYYCIPISKFFLFPAKAQTKAPDSSSLLFPSSYEAITSQLLRI